MGDRFDEYFPECYYCKETYAASETVLCNCLSIERSLVCPRCFHCFCKAPREYKGRFWELAPQELWDRVLKEQENSVQAKSNPSTSDIRRPLVLIVEPDNHIRCMAARIIEDLGYGVVLGEDGREGIVLANRYIPDLILSAAFMPKLDGREMCRFIKEQTTTSGIKVAVMTALYTQQKYKSEAFKHFHVDEFLYKPLAMYDLQTLLHKYLDNHE